MSQLQGLVRSNFPMRFATGDQNFFRSRLLTAPVLQHFPVGFPRRHEREEAKSEESVGDFIVLKFGDHDICGHRLTNVSSAVCKLYIVLDEQNVFRRGFSNTSNIGTNPCSVRPIANADSDFCFV